MLGEDGGYFLAAGENTSQPAGIKQAQPVIIRHRDHLHIILYKGMLGEDAAGHHTPP